MAEKNHSRWFLGRLRLIELFHKVRNSISFGVGFSLIRLGDGEGPLLGWPDLVDYKDLEVKLHRWFGPQSFSRNELCELADLLRSSVISADVVGLPSSAQYEIDSGYRRVFEAIEHYDLHRPGQAVCDAAVHWYLQFSGAIASIIRNRDFLGIVGCRVLGQEIERTFNIGLTETYLVRGEEQHRGPVLEPHWPIGFSKVTKQLKVPYPGAVFLVGAGALGKSYCELVKRKGGVAIDVGSLLDGWARVPSRARYSRAPEVYSLDYHRETIDSEEAMQKRLDKYILELGIKSATY